MIPDSSLNNYLPGRSRTIAALNVQSSKPIVFQSWNVPWDAIIASHFIFVLCHPDAPVQHRSPLAAGSYLDDILVFGPTPPHYCHSDR